MEKRVLRSLLEQKKMMVLKTLYFSEGEMYLREIAKKSGVPVATVFRILRGLVAMGLIRVKEVGMMKFFSLVRDGRERFLEGWFREESMLDLFVRFVSGLEGVEKLWLYEKADNNRANTILIGKGVDEGKIDEICEKFKDKGFDLSCAVFSPKQFQKLEKMGIYGGEKKVLL